MFPCGRRSPSRKYNSLQKLTYTLIPLLGMGSVLSGMSIYWPVQFGVLTALFGGYDTARIWHFIFTVAFVLFFFGHLFLVTISGGSGWSNFVSMISGWKNVAAESKTPAR